MTTDKTLHQFIVGAAPGDAITDHAFLLQRWLDEAGFESMIYAESVHPALEGKVRFYSEYSPSQVGELVILHHSIGSDLVDYLLGLGRRFLLIYHNITPPSFFQPFDPGLTRQLQRGREQLIGLRERTVLALADSPFNEAELKQAGYLRTGVLPIVLDSAQYDMEPNVTLHARYHGTGPNLLFVGRLVPNKRQEELIKLLYYVRRIAPEARLFLVGDPWIPTYAEWLRELAMEMGLGESVVLAGHVSQRDLVTYYRLTDVYVSMSEHEGFGKPLIESMYLGVPVLAYKATAVADTLGEAAILLLRKDYEAIAELIHIVVTDTNLRERVVKKQQQRVKAFLEPQVRLQWSEIIHNVSSYSIPG